MLQDIRKSTQGLAAKVIIGLIVISFAGFGIQSILVGGGSPGVAEVNGEEISAMELNQATNLHARRLISMLGENYDPQLLDEDVIRSQALDSLIGRKILMQAVQDMGLTVTEAEIGALIGSMEQFQIDGAFEPALYKQALSENGYTPSSFKQNLRSDMALIQLRAGLADSDFTTPTELMVSAAVLAEQRDFRYVTVPGEQFRQEQTVSEEQITAYYDSNQGQFLTEEAVDVSYIALSEADFETPVAEADVIEAYEIAVQSFIAGDENRLSHILLDTDNAEALATVQAEIAAGVDFAELATRYSIDVGSSQRGGDLGYSNGNAFPPEIENAIAMLEPGTVSPPVETEAGTHLLLVTERRAMTPPSLEDMRAQLSAAIMREEAQVELVRTVEELRDIAFNSEDLSGPAKELDLQIRSVEGVTRSSGDGLFSNAALRTAAFSEEVLKAGHNSEVLELAGNQFVVLHVDKHHEPRVRALAEVRDEIEALVSERLATAAVAAEAQAIIEQLAQGTPMDKLAAEKGYTWQVELAASRQAFSAPLATLRRAFELPREGLPVRDFLVDEAGNAIVIELIQVQEGSVDDMPVAEQQQIQRQTAQESGALVNNEYQQGLRQSADVVVM
ncbi:MAG: SurA N-terminal domain-containing protein [Gammaproteobacteria bacterium]|nr:SurA N-terminal domain-containing protein [Gammaproteobacteria bacterium]